MSDIGLNILELRILLHILRYKIDAKMFEQKIIMKNSLVNWLNHKLANMLMCYDVSCKLDIILYLIRDAIT